MLRIFGVVLICLMLLEPARAAEEPTKEQQLQKQSEDAFKKKDFATARKALEELAPLQPRNSSLRYNLACARAMLGDTKGATDALTDAFGQGFIDLFHMERDEQLDSIRDTDTYKMLIKGWREILDARAKADLEAMKRRFEPGAPPDGYTFNTDEPLRLNYASAFKPASFDDARAQISRVNAWAVKNFFPVIDAKDPRPDAWVSIILPTPKDFFRMVMSERIGGYYDYDRRRLITQDIGPSLRHEFFHVLHWRHMERLGQKHPYWIMEGMASLLEDVEYVEGTGFSFKPSWRTNIAKRLNKGAHLMPWERFFSLPGEKFMTQQPSANYAQARAVFLFLEQRGKLADWYSAYTRGFKEDPTGTAAMETVFAKSLKRVESEYRQWLTGLEEVAEQSRPADFTLGVSLNQGAGDGLVVDKIVTGSRWTRTVPNPLRFRDVILEIEGHPIRTFDDYHRVLGEIVDPNEPLPPQPPLKPDSFAEPDPPIVGKEVKVKVRRAGKEMELKVHLVHLPDQGFPF